MEHDNPSESKDRVPSEIRNKTYINKLNHTRHKKSVNVENPSGQISLWTMQQNQQNNPDLTRHVNSEHPENPSGS